MKLTTRRLKQLERDSISDANLKISPQRKEAIQVLGAAAKKVRASIDSEEAEIVLKR